MKLIDAHCKGAANELKAAEWYIARGHQIYLPVIQQGPVDFVVDLGDVLQKVQVKTASRINSSDHSYLQCRTRLTNKYQNYKPEELYDILFIVYENTGWVIPAKEVDSSNLSLESHKPHLPSKWDKFKIML